MPTESLQTTCPLCSSRVLFRFPQDWPSLNELEVLYTHAVLHASGDRRRQTARVLNIGYKAFQKRFAQALPERPRRPLSREEMSSAIEELNRSDSLKPVGSPGACSGSFSKLAFNDDVTVYGIRFNESVSRVSNREDVAKGKRPTITFEEATGEQRVFEFGDKFDDDMTVFIAPVRSQHCMAVVIRTEFEE